ncbi:MAG: alpha/beta hydrolase [Deltaproteobacteria bacterium]|nr:MAG: alpha/beta hydrolase [Deltaproteobacteria bacterium]
MRSILSLIRWLGPWTRPTSAPSQVIWSPIAFGEERPLTGRLYEPQGRMRGAYLMSPGLHPLGPEHPVLDRFCRILAASGFLVLCPSLPDHRRTLLTEISTRDLGAALDALRAESGVSRPALFAVSFGVLPAVRLAAERADHDHLSGLLLYGGHADFERTLRYVLRGRVDGERVRPPDLRLLPVPLMNLPEIPGLTGDRERLHQAWLAWMTEAWLLDGHAEEAWLALAARIREELPETLHPTYDLGTGRREGADDLVLDVLHAHPDYAPRYSPITYADGVRVPVVILHGVDDPVIHVSEAAHLAASLAQSPRVEVHVTGLYGHTRIAGFREILTMGRTLTGELGTAAKVVAGISRLAIDGHGGDERDRPKV